MTAESVWTTLSISKVVFRGMESLMLFSMIFEKNFQLVLRRIGLH
jgi:hypothetical protein